MIEYLKQPWGPAPAWVWLVTLVVLPTVNELLNRAKWTRAQSIIQGIARALLIPFGAIPVVGDVLRALAGPAAAPPPAGGGTGLLPILLALSLALPGCASGAMGARQGIATTDALVGAGYRAERAYVRAEAARVRERIAAADAAGAEALRARLEKVADKLLLALDVTADAADAAAAAIDVAEAAKKRDYAGILAPLADAVCALAQVFADAGLKLPALGVR